MLFRCPPNDVPHGPPGPVPHLAQYRMPPKSSRRSAEERIAALKAEIERIKTRAAEQKAKKDPALRHISGAIRSVEKAAAATKDAATKKGLNDARATLAACLALHGVTPGKAGRTRAAGPAPSPEKILAFLKKNPGSRSEAICAALGTDALSLRPVLHELRDQKKVKVSGKARATAYTAK